MAQADPLTSCRFVYPGDALKRYASGRITRNGTDLTAQEIADAIAAFQPTWDAIVAAREQAIADRLQRESDAALIKQNADVRALINASPAQIETWITNNVTDLPAARTVLIRLTQAVSAIGREAFVDD